MLIIIMEFIFKQKTLIARYSTDEWLASLKVMILYLFSQIKMHTP